jgi:hypothetical protein
MAWSATRRGAVAVAALWLLGVGFVARSGNSHGLVAPRIDRAALPYEWQGVLFESALMGVEAFALFWLLFKLATWRTLTRTLVAFVLFLALVACSIATTVTDMPGWYYVNTLWTMLVLLMLAVRLVAQLAGAVLARTRTRDA